MTADETGAIALWRGSAGLTTHERPNCLDVLYSDGQRIQFRQQAQHRRIFQDQ